MSSGSRSICSDAAVVTSEQLCYIHCNFCNIVLAVSVPRNSLFDIVTVKCGNCTNMWPVNVGMASLSVGSTSSSHHHQRGPNHQIAPNYRMNLGFPPADNKTRPRSPNTQDINNAPEKRQRVPSLYNRFIKEEIQRIKANNPDISHKEAFSTAAKNWAHFPHIQFGLMLENNHHQANLDEGLLLANDKA